MAANLIKSRRVIVRQDNCVLPCSLGKPWAFWDGRGILDWSKHIGIRARPAETDSQESMSPMIASLEFRNQGSPCRSPRQPDSVHGSLRTRVAEGHLIHARHHVADQPGKFILVLVALSIGSPMRQRLPYRRFDLV